MRIAALGDAHLGRAYLPYADNGVNVRERDFDSSFEAAVDLALSTNPDAVVWLGDIFDHPRPTYRVFRIVQRALVRLRASGLPVVVITGNHDTPRLPGTGTPYSALADAMEGSAVRFAHRMAYERVDLGEVVVHAVPQMLTKEATVEALDLAVEQRSLDATNVLLAHPLVPSVERRYADVNEIEVDDGLLRADLVLLGHYHTPVRVRPGIWYAGSTDTFTFADDPGSAKGIVVLDTVAGTCEHVPLTGQRPLVTLPGVDALGLSPAELSSRVLERAAAAPEGAVARLFIDDCDPEAYRLVDLEAVREAAAAALHLKLEPTFLGATTHVELADLQSVPARWDGYIGGQDLHGFDRDRLRDLGLEYLNRAVEEAG